MQLYYLDTSVLVKRYKPEEGSENIDRLFSSLPSNEKRLITSIFSIVEFASAGDRLAKSGTITKTTYGKMIKAFNEDAEQYFHFLSMDDGIVFLAAEMVKKYSIRPGDALQLASLKRSRDTVSGYDLEIVFLAADISLCKAAVEEGFRVLNPAGQSKTEWLDCLIRK